MPRVKVTYADGRVERYVSSAVFKRARMGDAQAIFYSAYIASPEWYARRAKHLARYPDCRGCGRTAVLVHHKTYETLGREPTKHLLSLCPSCHARIHLAVAARERQLRRRGLDVKPTDNARLFSITNYMLTQLRRQHGLATSREQP